jgi:hypothetical protein
MDFLYRSSKVCENRKRNGGNTVRVDAAITHIEIAFELKKYACPCVLCWVYLFFRSSRIYFIIILMLLTLPVTILVAIGIYVIDKKIVNHYIITRVVLAFSVFVAELFAFLFVCG